MNPYCLKSHFTLLEAAAAICDLVQPSRSDDFALQSVQRALIDAIKSGELKATVVTAYRTRTIQGSRPISSEPDRTERIPNGTDWSTTTIPRADLLTWCEQKGIRPPLLFPNSPPDKSAIPADLPDYHTPALDALRAAIAQFWLHHDPNRPPKKQDIIEWLIKNHGMTPAMASHIDQVIRPESRRKGGNTSNN